MATKHGNADAVLPAPKRQKLSAEAPSQPARRSPRGAASGLKNDSPQRDNLSSRKVAVDAETARSMENQDGDGPGTAGQAAAGEELVSSLGSDMDSQLKDSREDMAGLGEQDVLENQDAPLADGQGEEFLEEDSESMAESSEESEAHNSWVRRFLAERGNEFFCEIDEEYITDRFNLTGLNTEVDSYQLALDLISDNLDERMLEQARDHEELHMSARHLYGLIHARFVITHRGLSKMGEKFRREDFGRCPRVLCQNQPVLPIGLSDIPDENFAKVYCPRCEDVYTPSSRRHARIDGSYFGTSFPHLLFQVFPNLMPTKPAERYVPRIFGFRIHEVAEQHRKQDAFRERKEKALGLLEDGGNGVESSS